MTSMKCCELKGVPKDCMYACQEPSKVTSRNDVPCMDHENKIADCLEGERNTIVFPATISCIISVA